MPESLPAIPGAKVVRALERAGFTVVRIALTRLGAGRRPTLLKLA